MPGWWSCCKSWSVKSFNGVPSHCEEAAEYNWSWTCHSLNTPYLMLFTFHLFDARHDTDQAINWKANWSLAKEPYLWPTSPSYKTVIKDKAEDEQIHVKAATAENGWQVEICSALCSLLASMVTNLFFLSFSLRPGILTQYPDTLYLCLMYDWYLMNLYKRISVLSYCNRCKI